MNINDSATATIQPIVNANFCGGNSYVRYIYIRPLERHRAYHFAAHHPELNLRIVINPCAITVTRPRPERLLVGFIPAEIRRTDNCEWESNRGHGESHQIPNTCNMANLGLQSVTTLVRHARQTTKTNFWKQASDQNPAAEERRHSAHGQHDVGRPHFDVFGPQISSIVDQPVVLGLEIRNIGTGYAAHNAYRGKGRQQANNKTRARYVYRAGFVGGADRPRPRKPVAVGRNRRLNVAWREMVFFGELGTCGEVRIGVAVSWGRHILYPGALSILIRQLDLAKIGWVLWVLLWFFF